MSVLSRSLLIMLLVCAFVVNAEPDRIAGMTDRLETSSPIFENPQNSLFLDITRAGSKLVAVGERGLILVSGDEGRSWTQADVPVATTLAAVHFVDDQIGWACGHSGVVLNSSDGGRSWHVQFDGRAANQAVLAEAEAKVKRLQDDLLRAPDAEKADLEWALEDAQFALEDARLDVSLGPTKPMLDVWFRNRKEGYVIGAYGYFFGTQDGGATWQNYAGRLENFDRYHLNAIASLGDGTLMIVGEAGQMFASYDQGEYWETLYGPYQGSLFGIQTLAENGSALVFGLRGHVFKTPNGGGSWQGIEVPVETTLSAADQDGQNVTLVGFSGVVLESVDGGNSFRTRRLDRLESYNAVAHLSSGELLIASENGLRLTKP